ncbi:MAG: Uma2 family endonuclease [Actinomycetota bacterium]|nr:Uma2 family endonuclease [Actinomycetota bacterium]
MATATAPPGTALWSPDLETYHRMAELGLFGEDRVELLDGVLVAMSPKNAPHEEALNFLTECAFRTIDLRTHQIRNQSSLSLGEGREPEPDLVIVRRDVERPYHPGTAELVCEVAASSLRIDRTTKLAIYARAGIPEYWVVDVNARVVEVHIEPQKGSYAITIRLGSGTVAARLMPFSVPLDDLWAATPPR